MTTSPLAAMPLDHAGVSVADLDRSRAFYRDIFGFDVIEDQFELAQAGFRGMVLRNAAGTRIELFHKEGSEPRGTAIDPVNAAARHGWFQIAFRTDDVRGAFARAVQLGAQSVMEPVTAPDGKSLVSFVADPDGNLIELVERSA